MRRSLAYTLSLLLIGGFFAFTLFRTISLTAVWRNDATLPKNGESFSIVGRGGALEFESEKIFSILDPKPSLTWNSEEAEHHQPFLLPRSYEGEMNFSRSFELRFPKGFRIPLWPALPILLFLWIRPRKKRRK